MHRPFFWGSNNRGWGAHQHTNSPQTVWWSWHAGRPAYVPSSAGKLSAVIKKYPASSKFIIMWVKHIFKIQDNVKTTASACIFCRGVGHIYILIHVQVNRIHFLQVPVFHFPLKRFIYYKNNSQKSRRLSQSYHPERTTVTLIVHFIPDIFSLIHN